MADAAGKDPRRNDKGDPNHIIISDLYLCTHLRLRNDAMSSIKTVPGSNCCLDTAVCAPINVHACTFAATLRTTQ
jgi:hypothetical protein